MFRRILAASAGVVLLFVLIGPVAAQSLDYHVYLDSDRRADTGCTVNAGGQTFLGAEYRLTATVTGNPPRVTARTLSTCAATVFGAPATLGANHAVGLNIGLPAGVAGLADVVEVSLDRDQMASPASLMRIGFASASISGSTDVLFTANGQVGGPPMLVGAPAIVPTFGVFGGFLLAVVLLVLARRALNRHRRWAQAMFVAALVTAGVAAYAAVTTDDGQIGDWAGFSPVGADPLNDPVPNLAGTDLVGAYASDLDRRLSFRIDVVDAENRAPIAVADAYTVLEDMTLTIAAPGVLSNDSDPDGNPITAQLVTGPTRGTVALQPDGSFVYTPNPGANGTDTFTYNARDPQVPSAVPAVVTITITPVNDAPVFTIGANQTVLEDAGAQTVTPFATAIDDGDADAVQTLTFVVTNNTNPALFTAVPAINATGTLTYTAAADANGAATITVRLDDDGGNANGGVSQSGVQTFTITVTPVNDAPSFTAGANRTLDEDAAAQVVDPWATAISAGPADEAGQTVSFEITGNDNPGLFVAAPTVSATGVLTFTPAANANGVATVTLRARDSGGTANGGIEVSPLHTLSITINAINDAPVFTVGANQSVNENAGAQTVTGWATAIGDGDPEVTQALVFLVTNNTNPGLFSAAPAVTPTGDLSYTPSANTSGAATITLALQDDGSAVPPNINQSAAQTFTISVNDTAPAVAVTEVEVGNVFQTLPLAPANHADLDTDLRVTFSENVGVSGNWASLTCVVSGTQSIGGGGLVATVADPVYTLNPATNLTPGEACTLTVFAAGIVDDDATDPPDNMLADAIVTFTARDVAPRLTGTTVPGNGATVPSTQSVTFQFSEQVDLAAGSIAFDCGSPVAFTPALPASNVNTVTLVPTGNLPVGANCTVTLESTLITDVDTVDPPNQLDGDGNGDLNDGDADDVVLSFTVDNPPAVIQSAVEVSNVFAPLPLGTGVYADTDTDIRVTFNEPVNVSGNWATLTCTTSGTWSVGGGSLTVTAADPVFTLNPTSNLSPGEDCTLSVTAAQIDDDDTIDPPGNPLLDFTAAFTTRDAAPTVITPTVPANGAIVANLQQVTVQFSEVVDVAAGAATFTCGGGPVAFTPALPLNDVSTITLTPTAALPNGANCTVTLESTLITDNDAVDPPNQLDGDGNADQNDGDADDFVLSFSVDAAPSVVSTTPANGATGVPPTSSISIDFSESVLFPTTADPVPGNAAFDLVCGGSPTAFTVTSVSPNDPVVLDPVDNDVAGRSCTLTVEAAQITDNDTVDPPNTMTANFVATFSFASVANDDSVTVTPHLTYLSPSGITSNDVLGAGVVTGFGNSIGNANAVAPNGTNFVTAGGAGGRVILNADGTFRFLPDDGDNNASGTATFFYTVTGGDTAQVTITFEAEEFIWFADTTPPGTVVCTGSNIGTQSCPHSGVGAALGATLTTNDIIFMDSGTLACGLTLQNNVLMIGNGSSGTLSALAASRVTPVAGSNFAPYDALNGIAPVLNFAGNCIVTAQNNTLRGFTIGDTTATGTDISGTNFGTLTVAELTLTGTGRTLNLDNGTLNGVFLDVNASASNDEGIRLTSVGGTWSVQDQIAIGNVTGTGIHVFSTPAGGSATFTGGLAINKSSAGTGLSLSGNASPINLGAVSITTGSGTAMSLAAGAGLVSTSSGTVAATSGPAIEANAANLDLVLTSASSTNSTSTGLSFTGITGSAAIAGGHLSEPTATAFAAAGSLGSGVSYGGNMTKTMPGYLVRVTGAAAGNLTLAGTLSCTVGCGSGAGEAGIEVSGRTGGTILFSGPTKTLTMATTPGVRMTGNTGATISFPGGGLNITTTSGTGFTATGGGVVNVTGSSNTIAATTGIALVVDHPASQATNLTFATVAATGAVSTHGIDLNNISGSVTVTGATTIGGKTTAGIEITNSTATIALSTASTVTINNRPNNGIRIANSGGTIGFGNTTINSTGVGTPAIRIDASTSAVTFAQTNINMAGAGGNENFLIGAGPAADDYTPRDNAGDGDAIYVTGLTGGLTINGGSITQPGDDGIDIRSSANLSITGMTFTEAGRSAGANCVGCNSSGIQAFGLTGTNSIANSTFLRGRMRNFYISNPAGSTTLNVTGSTFDDTRSQGSGSTDNMQIYLSGNATAAYNIANSTFLKSATHQINAVAKDNAVITELDITGITMNPDGGSSSGIHVNAENAAQVAMNVIGNPVLYSRDENIITMSAGGTTSRLRARVHNNPDMRFSTASPGGSVFVGLRVLSDGTNSQATVSVENNTILVDNGTDGITMTTQQAGAARIDARVVGNTFTAAGAAGIPLDAVHAIVNPTVGGSKVVCLTATGNTVNGIWARAARARGLSPTGTFITGYSGSYAATWIAQGNVGTVTNATEGTSAGGVVGAPPTACVTPDHGMP